MKTKGEVLNNNWNIINRSNGEERILRIAFQNCARELTEKDIIFYEKYMWNKRLK